MLHDKKMITSQVTLGADVAGSGTFSVSYPTGYAENHFSSVDHKISIVNGGQLFSGDNFTVSFGASAATITLNSDESTILAGTMLYVELALKGNRRDSILSAIPGIVGNKASLLQPVEINLGAPDVADPNGVIESQAITAADGPATGINGVLATGGVATFDVPRNVVASWTGTAVMTVTGTDEYGNVMAESSGSGTSMAGKKAFKTVTAVTVSADVTSATVGTGSVLGMPLFIPDGATIIQEFRDGSLLARKGSKVYMTGKLLEAAVDAGTGTNIPSPVKGSISSLKVMANDTITTGGAITVNVGTTAVVGLSVTVASGAAEGEYDSDAPTTPGSATTLVDVGSRIEIIPASAFNASADLSYVLEIDVAAVDQLDGTLVVGDAANPSATSGDVRGTYTPSATLDGAINFGMVALLEQPDYLGATQYAG